MERVEGRLDGSGGYRTRRDRHEVAWVVAAAHRDELERADHVRVDEPDDPVRQLPGLQAKRATEVSQGLFRELRTQAHAAAEEVVRIEDSGCELGIGDGRV